MLKPKKIICFLPILLLTAGAWAQKKERALSLEDCILKAMQNNLNVAVEVLNPELADISVSRAKEDFLPSLSFGYSLQNTNSPSISYIEGEEKISTEFNDYSASIFQRIPTGENFRYPSIPTKTIPTRNSCRSILVTQAHSDLILLSPS